MRITRPYGRTVTDKTDRKLTLRDDSNRDRDITEFATTHPELLVAQWISILDKIARKPSGQKKPTKEQRAFRKKLGAAMWGELARILPEDLSGEKRDYLSKLWESKVHPYPRGNYVPASNKPNPKTEGHWYEAFCGKGSEPTSVDTNAVAKKALKHLHESQIARHSGDPIRQSGLIISRAGSISSNKLKLKDQLSVSMPDNTILKAYQPKGVDPVKDIYEKVKASPKFSTKDALHSSAGILREHYSRVFGRDCSISKAKENHPELFELHSQVRDTFRQLLKRSSKKHEELLKILPQNLDALLKCSASITTNRSINDEIRLGKVIHYHLLNEDSTSRGQGLYKATWEEHIGTVKESPFWHSDGQTRIKQTEAFIRIFRRAIAFMARNLREISSLNAGDKDILTETPREAALRNFDNPLFEKNINIMFGKSVAERLLSDAEHNKDLFEFLLKKTADLRNSIFHFNGLDDLQTKMVSMEAGSDLAKVFSAIWDDHQQQSRKRLLGDLSGLMVANYLNQNDVRVVISLLGGSQTGILPLPRFSRLVATASNLGRNLLSDEITSNNLQDPALKCQYGVMKLLYERPFRHWLDRMEAEMLNTLIRESLDEGNSRAISANSKQPHARDIITSKASNIIGERHFKTLGDFLNDLTAETASEMRVQRGYQSDPEKARDQAKYIEQLKCDVVARAFEQWLIEKGLRELRQIEKGAAPSDGNLDLEIAEDIWESPTRQAEPWLHGFYILLYLMPVSEASALLHQIAKWQNATAKNRGEVTPASRLSESLTDALHLYLDMHDAVQAGPGQPLMNGAKLKDLFENEEDFKRVFPISPDDGASDIAHLPMRGLREILRFGGLKATGAILSEQKISPREVEDYFERREQISEKQEQREKLHKQLCRNKNPSREDLQKYRGLVSDIAIFRYLSAQVTLTNHVRLHQLLVSVLARLVDYTGLWERDLYFITLAKIYRSGQKPETVFSDSGICCLAGGQIVFALRFLKSDQSVIASRTFPNNQGNSRCPQCGNCARCWRNRFAHFNMLQSPDTINLTQEINTARQLMDYDRKLKNAVSKSIIELLHREGIQICWQMDCNHQLGSAKIASRLIKHLNGKGGVKEDLQGEAFVKLVAKMFNGEVMTASQCDEKRKQGQQGNRQHHKPRQKGRRNRQR